MQARALGATSSRPLSRADGQCGGGLDPKRIHREKQVIPFVIVKHHRDCDRDHNPQYYALHPALGQDRALH